MRPALPLACLLAAVSTVRADIVLPAADAIVTAPMTRVEGVLQQPTRTELPATQCGSAVFTVQIPEAGEYVVQGIVDAPTGAMNSFYVTFDEAPTTEAQVWDIVQTTDFEERMVCWRGTGALDDPEFDPMVFALTAGEHRLIITGREPARLKNVLLRRYERPKEGTLEAMKQVHRVALWRLRRQLASGRTEEAAGALYKQTQAIQTGLYADAVKLAKAQPGSSAGLAALDWVVHELYSQYGESGPESVALLKEYYARDPGVAPSVAYLAHYLPWEGHPMDLGVRSLFRAVAETNPDRAARGQAQFGLALLAKRHFDQLEATGKGEAALEASRQAVALMEGVRRDYGDCLYLSNPSAHVTLGKRAEEELVELRALRLGMPAPEIVDRDLDGVTFKLSDYRGKVVMLVFWASWCGPCMHAVPHEKELVERYAGRPFALIGVNGDGTVHDAQKSVAREGIPWRSFWNGADDHIADAWNVRGWPTVYLIDHEGFIRQRVFFDEAALEPLVQEAEKKR